MNDHTEIIPVKSDNPFPLGRHLNHDPRNANFMALVQPPHRASVPGGSWYSRDVYDQGHTSKCVIESSIGMLKTHPNTSQFREKLQYNTEDKRTALYNECQSRDPWAATPHDGTSTEMALKLLKEKGSITGYRWLSGGDQVIEWLDWYSPCIIGINWYDGMFYPDANGFIKPSGTVAGGHAIRLVQHSISRKAVRVVNSWGTGWGQGGRAWISEDDLKSLLAEDGEAVCIA